MELAAGTPRGLGTSRSVWLWVPVLAVGLGSLLVPNLPPDSVVAVARPAALRLLAGDFGVSWGAWAALVFVASWLVAKPLAIVGALLLLEFRFSPGADSRNHLLRWVAQSLSIAFVLGAAAVMSLLDMFPEPLIKIGEPGSTMALLLITVPAFILNMLVVEFLLYWTHRAMHRVPFLWRFHALHHSLDINALNNVAHPVDYLVAILFTSIPAAFLIGVSQGQISLLVAFTALQGYLNHTRLPIDFGPLSGTLLTDNRYHFIHHSREPAHHDKNFAGRFPVLDMLFGTYVPPGDGLIDTGLIDREQPHTFGQYLSVRLPQRSAERAI